MSVKNGMERKAYAHLLEWKETMHGSTAIRLDGARRVGKTYLVKEFAKNEYKSGSMTNRVGKST